MYKLVNDIKRAWRLFKLVRNSEVDDEQMLEIEKVDTLYIRECRSITRSIDKTRRSLNRALQKWKGTNSTHLSNLEDTLSSAMLQTAQMLEASQEALSKRLGQVEQSTQTAVELIDNVREYVAKQADETRRWQEIYDWRLLKNYLMSVISTLDNVEAQLESLKKAEIPEEIIQKFDFLRETLELHLEEEGLVSFSSSVGASPDPARDEINLSTPSTSESEVIGTIAEVTRKGYEIDLGAETKIIRKAQVTIYKK